MKNLTNKKYDITWMGNKPLSYDVIRHDKVIIPKGTTYVGIAFRQSEYSFRNPRSHRRQNLNVYFWKSPDGHWVVVHAH